MAAPSFVAKSAFASGTGALTVGAVSGTVADDLVLLFVESANQAIATPTGYTEVTNSPQSTGTAAAAGGVRLAVFYKFLTATDTTTSVADTGDHTTAIKAAYRGADPTTPIHITAGAVQSSAGTSWTLPSVTTTLTNTTVVFVLANDRDSASTTNTSGWTNSNITLTERHDETVTSGAGGGISFADGTWASAGATGTTAVTNAASNTAAFITVAIATDPNPPVSTGWLNPTANSGTGWTGLANLYASDNARATATTTGTAETPYFFVGNFTGLSIPSGATIKGIEVNYEGAITSGTFSYAYSFIHAASAFDFSLRSVTATGPTLTATEAASVVGSPTDLWGEVDTNNDNVKDRAWASTDFDSGLYVGFAAAATAGGTFSLDQIQLRVWYRTTNTTIAVPLLTGTQTLLTPVVNARDVVAVPLKTFTQTLFAPNVNIGERIAVPLLAGTQTLLVPTVNARDVVAVPLKTFTQTLQVPVVNARESIAAPLLTFTETLFAPSVNIGERIAVPLLSFAQTLQVPTVNARDVVAVPLKTFTQSLLTPTVNVIERIAVPLLSINQTLLTPNVNARDVVAVPLKTFTQSLLAPTTNARDVVAVPLKTFTQTLLVPTVNAREKIAVPLKTFTQTLFAPIVIESLAIQVPKLTFTQSLLTPTINARESINVPLLSFTQSLIAPTVDEVTDIAVPLLTFTQTLYPPTIVEGAVVVQGHDSWGPTKRKGRHVNAPNKLVKPEIQPTILEVPEEVKAPHVADQAAIDALKAGITINTTLDPLIAQGLEAARLLVEEERRQILEEEEVMLLAIIELAQRRRGNRFKRLIT